MADFWTSLVHEPCHEKNRFLPVQKQRRNSSSPYSHNFMILAFFRGCIGGFVSDLVGNPEDWFSQVAAHMHFRIKYDNKL